MIYVLVLYSAEMARDSLGPGLTNGLVCDQPA